MSKISIITINYNNKQGLEKTILSVINQTIKNFEYIVIDGNSNDGSKELIETYQTQISYSVSEPDHGIYHAMNKGIKAAKGDYLLFLNSGDCLFENNVIEKIEACLDGKKSFYYGNLCTSKDGVRTHIYYPPNELSLTYFVLGFLPHQATFIKRELFEKYMFYNETNKILSDWEFFVLCIVKYNETYEHINYVVSDFDMSGFSSSDKAEELIRIEQEKFYEQYFPRFKKEIEVIKFIGDKRLKQFYTLSKFKIRWKVLKAIMKLLLIFNTEEVEEKNAIKKIVC